MHHCLCVVYISSASLFIYSKHCAINTVIITITFIIYCKVMFYAVLLLLRVYKVAGEFPSQRGRRPSASISLPLVSWIALYLPPSARLLGLCSTHTHCCLPVYWGARCYVSPVKSIRLTRRGSGTVAPFLLQLSLKGESSSIYQSMVACVCSASCCPLVVAKVAPLLLLPRVGGAIPSDTNGWKPMTSLHPTLTHVHYYN